MRHCGLGQEWLIDLNAEKTKQIWFDQSYNTSAINVEMDGSILEEK